VQPRSGDDRNEPQADFAKEVRESVVGPTVSQGLEGSVQPTAALALAVALRQLEQGPLGVTDFVATGAGVELKFQPNLVELL